MAQDSPALVALDLGTSTAKAAAWAGGRLRATARRELASAFPAPGRVEQDPDELVAAAHDVVAEVARSLPAGAPAVLGVTNQRSTVVLWDGTSGRALGPALSWRDARAGSEARALELAVPDLAQRTGLPASPHYGAPKLAWALAHWPEARRAAADGRLRVGPLSTWVCWRLSSGRAFAVDPTNAQRLLLLDLERLDWDDELVAAAGVPRKALPEVRPCDGDLGEVDVGGRRLAVRACLGDQQAALLGHADDGTEGGAAVQLGTGGFVLREAGPTPVRVAGLLAGVARVTAAAGARYLVEGTINAAGVAFDRLRDLGLLREGEDVDALVDAARAPAVLLPAWGGLAAPWWQPSCRAALADWSEATSRADLVAGAVHGLAFLVADIVDALDAGGLGPATLLASGPVSRLRSLSQAMADATQRPVRLRESPEASLEGVARALAEAVGAPAPESAATLGPRLAPQRDLTAARARFAALREAATRLAGEPS